MTLDSTDTTFEELMHRHQAGVWRYVRALGAAPAEADDVTQEVFVLAHRRIEAVPEGTGAGRWLRRVARDRLVDLRRAQRRWSRRLERYARELDAAWSPADDAADGGPWLAALRRCVDALDDRARAVIDAFYRDGLSRQEIGARLGMAEGSVKSRLFRIRSALRACIEGRLARDGHD